MRALARSRGRRHRPHTKRPDSPGHLERTTTCPDTRRGMFLSGVINLDKPAGLSSARCVDRVKRLLPRGTKIGHAGTLDPFATGVLLLLVGKATKSCEELMGRRKGYDATIKLGARTVTDDPESPEEPVAGAAAPSEDQVREAAARFVGAIQQTPPAFSAMKVGGQRAYKIARQGGAVEMKARTVQVYS